MFVGCDSRSSYFMLVIYDRHFGDICHVFECVDQSARSLVEALHDVTLTSHETAERNELSHQKEKKQTVNASSKNVIDKFVDDQNNNSLLIGTVMVHTHYM